LASLVPLEIFAHIYSEREKTLLSKKNDEESATAITKATADLKSRNSQLASDLNALRAQVADRHLTPEARAKISKNLRQFRGQPFSLITYIEEREPTSLLNEMREMLTKDAEWKEIPMPSNAVDLGLGLVVGIQVDVATTRSRDFMHPAEVLASVLSSEGISAISVVNPRIEQFADRIQISVGKKPN
jgi:hypothetical protein